MNRSPTEPAAPIHLNDPDDEGPAILLGLGLVGLLAGGVLGVVVEHARHDHAPSDCAAWRMGGPAATLIAGPPRWVSVEP